MEELSAAAPPRSAAGRFAQVALAALLTLGSLAYSVGLTRAAGLVLFPEQFLAAIYGVCLALLFISFPAARGTPREIPWYDWLFAAAGLAVGLYVAMTFPRLTAQAGTVTFELLFLAAVLAFLTLEGTRRTSGYSLIIITFVLVVWVLIGHLVPGQLQTHKVEAKTLAIYLSFDNNGLLGLVLEIACTIVVAFVLMGQLLARSGGSGFFNDFALGLMGRYRGGAAKISVVASSLFGSISGIAAASALAVGVVTIPLMKKSGIPARLAAAIEACAANGAQMMPPVMGAVAFVMADFLQVPYREVALAALLPSLLYYAALFIQCDLETARYGIGRVDRSEIPGMGPVLRTGWIFLAPFAAIVGAMFWLNWEPEPAAALASAIIIALGLAIGYRGARMKLADIWSAIIETGIGVCEIIVISAIGGYVLGLFQIGGLSFALTATLVNLGAENLLLLLVICAITNIVLGLGLPTLAVYVMLAILVAPALVKVGVPPMAAHLFILYFGIMSLITPPIATAAFVAATIAKTDPMAAGWTAMRFGWASYIVPFLFVYSPALIMRGSAVEIGLVMILSIAGIWFVCAAFTGYAMRVMRLPMRVAFAAAGLLLLMPFQASTVNAWLNVLGAVLGVALLIYEFGARSKEAA
ncbi:MAG: TRAP transporter fused permease subunit [Betaproteobacteria bacterium]|nr:MAG: TRAP transporter fused permease subunit [Betaproteobacteria bacterium]